MESVVFRIGDSEIKEKEEELRRAAAFLREGRLVVFPTETVYGLGANALDEQAAKKIFEVKGRPQDNPLIVHVSDKKEIEKYAVVDEISAVLIEKFMPGACTVVLKRRSNIKDIITAGRDTVAIRIPENKIAKKLIELAGVPIAAPSANLSKKPSLTEFKHILRDLNGKVSAIIDGGMSKIGLESTVLASDGKGVVNILRPGAVTKEMLDSLFEGKIKIVQKDNRTLGENEKPESPGMKYRHYSPEAPLFLVEEREFANSETVEFMKEKLRNSKKKIGLLCFDEYKEELEKSAEGKNCVILSIGGKYNPKDQAQRLFHCLNSFNDCELDEIYSVVPENTGVGAAIFNRLIKAAEYKIIKL